VSRSVWLGCREITIDAFEMWWRPPDSINAENVTITESVTANPSLHVIEALRRMTRYVYRRFGRPFGTNC